MTETTQDRKWTPAELFEECVARAVVADGMSDPDEWLFFAHLGAAIQAAYPSAAPATEAPTDPPVGQQGAA